MARRTGLSDAASLPVTDASSHAPGKVALHLSPTPSPTDGMREGGTSSLPQCFGDFTGVGKAPLLALGKHDRIPVTHLKHTTA